MASTATFSSNVSISGILNAQSYEVKNYENIAKTYNFKLNGIKSKHDLMNDNSGVYGEENLNWSSENIKGFIKINSNSSRIFKQINK